MAITVEEVRQHIQETREVVENRPRFFIGSRLDEMQEITNFVSHSWSQPVNACLRPIEDFQAIRMLTRSFEKTEEKVMPTYTPLPYTRKLSDLLEQGMHKYPWSPMYFDRYGGCCAIGVIARELGYEGHSTFEAFSIIQQITGVNLLDRTEVPNGPYTLNDYISGEDLRGPGGRPSLVEKLRNLGYQYD